jgi:hypothetical protein
MSYELSPEEMELYYIVQGKGGSFKTKLFEAICAADLGNQARLAIGFPEFVEVVQRYQVERDYWQKIKDKMSKQ